MPTITPLAHRNTAPKTSPFKASLSQPPRTGGRPRVLAYQRVSMHEDSTGSHTFETQSLRIREKLDQQYEVDGYDLEVLTDNGVSGASGLTPSARNKRTRPTLRLIADKLATKQYDCFIVYSFSRLARNPGLFHQLLDEVIFPSGVDFISVTQDINMGRADGRAMAGMLAVFDGFYRDSVIERNKDAAATRAQQGYYVGQVGYGWEWEPLAQVPPNGRRRIRPVAEQGKWIVQMKDWYLSGWSFLRIVGELNSLGVPSPSGQSLWTMAVVTRIMLSPVHAGLVPLGRGGQEWREGEHVSYRYYDPEVLEEMRQTRAGRKRWKTNTLHTAHHMLNGLVYCDRCGMRLHVSSANSIYRAYRCERGTAQGRRTCPDLTVRADALEAAVLRELEQFARQPAMRELLLREVGKSGDAEAQRLLGEGAQLRERSAVLQTRFERLAESMMDGTLSKAEFSHLNAKISTEREDIAERLSVNEVAVTNREHYEAWTKRVQAAVLDLPLVWAHLNEDERRELLSLVLEKLTVDRVGPDAHVKIKVRLLPERTIIIGVKSTVNMKVKPTGLLALTPRHLAILYHVGQQKTRAQIARDMQMRYATLSSFATQIYRILEVRDLEQAAEMARERIEALLPTLPLGAYRNKVAAEETSESSAPVLSPTLMEILPLLVQGATAKEIAKQTGLSLTTVAGRRTRILEALEVGTVYEAGQKARELGLLAAV